MPKPAKKSFTAPFTLLICLVALYTSGVESVFALMPRGHVMPVSTAEAEKLQVAEVKAAPAHIERQNKPAGPAAIEEIIGREMNDGRKTREDEQNIMEEALSLVEESEKRWRNGELESGLELLDQAYALIIETNDDPITSRQKDDLRLLISKRILAIYSSRQTVTVGRRSEIPLTMNADVEKEIRSFQNIERDFFISSYHRSGLYRPMIVRELKKAGLPEELSWLPLVESGFKVLALSKARALGPWQFIPSTGYKYGLNRDEWIDERIDPEKSTQAAIGYLKDLHDMFGDWLTVLAAYNCGEGRVLRVISSQHLNYLDRFWDLYHMLPYETARYVPRFLATLHIIKDPGKFGMDLDRPSENPLTYEKVQTNRNMRLRDIAAALDIPEETLITLNPELRHRMTPNREYALKVPPDAAEKYSLVADRIQLSEIPRQVRISSKSGFVRHKVKRGESAASIAHRYGISTEVLMSFNGLSTKRGVRVGQQLRVPLRGVRYAAGSAGQKNERHRGQGEQNNIYKVRSGDTLSSIAQQFKTTPAEIKKNNQMKTDTIRVGQTIRIIGLGGASRIETVTEAQNDGKKAVKGDGGAPAPDAGATVYTVQKGDSLDRIAKKSNVSLARILELNGMDTKTVIRPGQNIIVK